MTIPRTLALAAVLPLLSVLAACSGDPEPAAEAAAPAGAPELPATTEADAGVTFEPAYPIDVTEKGLTAEDAAQQQATHSHGGEEHSHAEGEDHDHGDDGHDDHEP